MTRTIMKIVLGTGLLMVLALFGTPSTSQDLTTRPVQEGHDLFHKYYQHWYNGRGTHCCDERHCRPAQAGEFRWHNGGWQVRLRGAWQHIKATDHVRDDGGLGPFGSICHTGTHVFCVDLPDAQM